MNINARDGMGEFSIKDEAYATIVVTELAKILLRNLADIGLQPAADPT